MQKAHIKGFIVGSKDIWDETVSYTFLGFDPSNMSSMSGYFTICEHEFWVDIPDSFNITEAQVKALNQEKEKVRADFAKRITELDAKINSLLSIEG
jgi:hypothetical protein